MKRNIINETIRLPEDRASLNEIRMSYGEWPYDEELSQRFDREGAEMIVRQIDAIKAKGGIGIPVYQGHPDVDECAARYPDKGAIGWVVEAKAETDALVMRIEWDRYPGRGFAYFSPFWGCEELDEGGRKIAAVRELISVGLTNTPRIKDFRLPNEAGINNQKKDKNMDPKKLAAKLGLPEDATEEQLMLAVDALIASAEAVATANARCEKAENECAEMRKRCENSEKELANEREKTEIIRLLKTKSVTEELPNEERKNQTRMEIANEIMRKENCSFTTAWMTAKNKNPELFK